MKRLIIIPLFVIFSSLTTPSDKVQGDSVKIEAQKMTNKQIDSVYRTVHITPYIDATRNEFKALRSHMDSLNALSILRERQIEEDAVKRDSMTHSYLTLLIKYTELKEQSAVKDDIIRTATQAPIILFYFIIFYIASIVGKGIVIGLKKKIDHE